MTPAPSPASVVLVSSTPLPPEGAAMRLARLAGSAAPARAGDPSEAYVLIERTMPGLVLVSAEIAADPAFEGLLALFRAIGVAWARLGPGPVAGLAAGARTVPVLPPDTADTATLTTALATLRAEARAAAAALLRPTRPVPVAARGQAQGLAQGQARDPRLILIGASTGGIEALMRILAVFPADCPPVAIVQHTGASFSDSLLRLLQRSTAAEVLPAGGDTRLQPGRILLAGGSPGHLVLRPGTPLRGVIQAGPPVSGHVPSVDMLFHSALPAAPRVAAALLTGMGRDGAEGLLALRRAGALTFAQDEVSSIVFGMPKAARDLGAASQLLPPDRIALALLNDPLPQPAADKETVGGVARGGLATR